MYAEPLVGHGFAAKILFAIVLHNLHKELAGSRQIAKHKARKPLHPLRGDERWPATVPISDRERLIGQGQRRARLAPQISSAAQFAEDIYRISGAAPIGHNPCAGVRLDRLCGGPSTRPLHHIAQSHLQSHFAAVLLGRFGECVEGC